jgi:hypothetical protein
MAVKKNAEDDKTIEKCCIVMFICCGSGMFIPDSASASKNLSILSQKMVPSSRKYDPGCSSRIRIPEQGLDFLPIPDPGSRGQKAPDPDPQHWLFMLFLLME